MYQLPTDLQNIIYTFDTNDVNKQLYNKVMNELDKLEMIFIKYETVKEATYFTFKIKFTSEEYRLKGRENTIPSQKILKVILHKFGFFCSCDHKIKKGPCYRTEYYPRLIE
jgi:hypothetical protein